jgi:hypothetical protein
MGASPLLFHYVVQAGGGAGGYRTSFPGGTKIVLPKATYPITVGAGGTGSNTLTQIEMEVQVEVQVVNLVVIQVALLVE